MSGSQNTMTSVYGKMNDSKVVDLVCGHGLGVWSWTDRSPMPRRDRKNPWELASAPMVPL